MPTANTLTDPKCRAAKATGKPQKLFDGHGLYLFISPTGSKIWRMSYRRAGKAQTATLGPYPLLSLADARVKRDAVRRQLLDGVDIRARPQAAARTFTACREAYWLGRHDVSDGYKANATRGLEMHVEPHIGSLAMASITREQLLTTLLTLDRVGKHVYAKRLRMWAGQVFDYGVEHGDCPGNPAAQIKPEKAFGRKRVVHHASLQLSDVPEFMQRLALEDDLQSVLACRLLAMTWVRTKELRFMKVTELEGLNGPRPLWRIPEGKMKRRREHLVPLPRQAVALIKALLLRNRGSEYVLPGAFRLDRPISENTVLYMIYRIGFKGKMTGHGFRSVGSTWANENEFNRDHIEMQLSHEEENEVRGTYNGALYLPQRRLMLQAWGDWLERMGQSPGV